MNCFGRIRNPKEKSFALCWDKDEDRNLVFSQFEASGLGTHLSFLLQLVAANGVRLFLYNLKLLNPKPSP